MLKKTRVSAVGVLTAVVFVVAAAGQAVGREWTATSPAREASTAGSDYAITRSTVAAGGGTSSGDGFVVRGTAGQPAGGDFVISEGFWQPAEPPDCNECPTDFDSDGEIGSSDLAVLLFYWGPCAPSAECARLDSNNDGDIGPPDLASLLFYWGPCS